VGNRFEIAADRACARIVAAATRRPGAVVAAAGLVTLALAVYAGRNLGVDADPRSLIDRRLPFQVRQRDFTRTFHTLGDGILVAIDADSPAAARRAADALADRLRARPDLFTQVHVPGGGPFFERHALLYLTTEQLEELTDRLSRIQPFLAHLARDPSLAGVADLLRQALASARAGRLPGIDLATTLDRVSAAIEATTAGRPAADPWGTALLGGSLPEEARRRVVALRPTLDYGTLLNAAPAVAAIREAVAALALDPAHGVRVRITGEPVLNYEELIAIGAEVWRVALVSLVLFTAAMWFAVRSGRLLAALVASLLVSLVWTNAFAAAAVGHLNQISAAFNVLIIGLGGELGIHFSLRHAELLAAGRSRRAALVETADSIGSSLFSSAGTTAIGFYVFLLTDFTGVGQLGLIAGTGLFLSLACTLTLLPALLVLGEASTPTPVPVTPAWATRLEHLPLRWAASIRVAAVVVALAALALVPRVRFDHNLLRLRDPGTESVQTFEDLLSRSGTSPWTIDVVAPSLVAARDLAARLAALPSVARARTALDYVPEAQEAKREILATAALFVPATVATAAPADAARDRAALLALGDEAARATGAPVAASAARLRAAIDGFVATLDGQPAPRLAALQTNVVGSLPEQLRELLPLLDPRPVTLADLPADLTEQMIAPDGRARIEVFPREDLSESAALERFVDGVRTLAPDATGSAVWLVEWGRVTWTAMRRALLGGMLCMAFFLVVLWRSAWDSLLAFFPLALATCLTCAAMVLVGLPFNFANVIALPMLIGMGVDNGVHLVHRHRTNPDEVDVLATSTARAVFFAAVTTTLSFGSMGFAAHRGIASFGQLLTIGVGMTLLCYVVVLPAVLEWDDRRRRSPRGDARAARRAG
jgi:hypothetical protein